MALVEFRASSGSSRGVLVGDDDDVADIERGAVEAGTGVLAGVEQAGTVGPELVEGEKVGDAARLLDQPDEVEAPVAPSSGGS
jgi:hypothetical protein